MPPSLQTSQFEGAQDEERESHVAGIGLEGRGANLWYKNVLRPPSGDTSQWLEKESELKELPGL